MSKRKFKKGPQITSLDRLAAVDMAIVAGKTYLNGWIISWPVRMAQGYIRSGLAYEAVKLTNEEYYEGRSQKSLMQQFREAVCFDCPKPSSWQCNNSSCDAAYQIWLKKDVAL